MQRVVVDEIKLISIADEIRAKTGGTDPLTLDDMAENIPKVYEAGQNEMWDCLTNYGNKVNYNYAFFNWGGEYIRPNRKIIPISATSASSTFNRAIKLKKIEAEYFDFSQKKRGASVAQGFYYTMYECGELEEVEDIGMQADAGYTATFANDSKLHTIAKIRSDEETTFSSAFSYCNELVNVGFEGVIGKDIGFPNSNKLSVASMKGIIARLKNWSETDYEDKYKLTFTADRWKALEADSAAPDGGTWREYVHSLGWNT